MIGFELPGHFSRNGVEAARPSFIRDLKPIP